MNFGEFELSPLTQIIAWAYYWIEEYIHADIPYVIYLINLQVNVTKRGRQYRRIHSVHLLSAFLSPRFSTPKISFSHDKMESYCRALKFTKRKLYFKITIRVSSRLTSSLPLRSRSRYHSTHPPPHPH